ncbi:TPA: protein VraC, partial [Staphylococcus aureus]|nr:protein VraC [Staphylococcus aureus]
MQHYLLDSNQRLNVSFSKDSVAAYYHCFNQPYSKEVPPLM